MTICDIELNRTTNQGIQEPVTKLVRGYSKDSNSWDGFVSGPTGNFKVTVRSVTGLFEKCIELEIKHRTKL